MKYQACAHLLAQNSVEQEISRDLPKKKKKQSSRLFKVSMLTLYFLGLVHGPKDIRFEAFTVM